MELVPACGAGRVLVRPCEGAVNPGPLLGGGGRSEVDIIDVRVGRLRELERLVAAGDCGEDDVAGGRAAAGPGLAPGLEAGVAEPGGGGDVLRDANFGHSVRIDGRSVVLGDFVRRSEEGVVQNALRPPDAVCRRVLVERKACAAQACEEKDAGLVGAGEGESGKTEGPDGGQIGPIERGGIRRRFVVGLFRFEGSGGSRHGARVGMVEQRTIKIDVARGHFWDGVEGTFAVLPRADGLDTGLEPLPVGADGP